jgi:hypothetical protein
MKMLLLSVASLLAAFETGIPLTALGSPCDAVLIQNIEITQLNTSQERQYLSIIDQSTWDQKRTDASFLASINDLVDSIPPLSTSTTFDQFSEARATYFTKTQFSSDDESKYLSFRKFLTDTQVEGWVRCVTAEKEQSGPKIFEREVTSDTVALELFWVAPPGFNKVSVKTKGSTISGGTTIGLGDLAANQLLPDNYVLDNQAGKTIQIHRSPNEALVVTLVAEGTGSASYSLRACLKTNV